MVQSVSNLNNVKKIAIIAGKGWLPRHVLDGCVEKDIECEIIAIEDQFSQEIFEDKQYYTFPIYAIGKIIAKIKSLGISYVVLAGTVKRAGITKLLLDLKGAKLLTKIMKAGLNDDAILSTIITFLESEGFTVIPPEKIATSIVVNSGFLTNTKPDNIGFADIKKGVEILKAVANFDVGQALVIQNGLVLGVEAAEGTDELIKRCGLIQQKDEEMCILVKICKPNQDKRIDLPCIGTETIKNLYQYNFKGVALEAGSALILNKEETIADADKLGLFIYGI